ncbi:MAG: TerC family protein [Syntrophales bacterium]
MDVGMFGRIDFSMGFVMAFLSIVLIDLVLAGDNAVVIAMAIKTLPKEKRFLGLLAGAGGAVVLRVICTFVVAKFLAMPYVRLAGGAVITWIGIKLMVDCAEEEECRKEASTILQALWIIMIADISMSIDNMLAVGAASKGNLFLLIFGLMLSIPFVVFASSLICKLMDRFPIILWLGAAILGKVGGEMIITDPFIVSLLHPTKVMEYGTMVFFVAIVVATSKITLKRRAKRAGAGIPADCDGDHGGPSD